MNEYHDQANPAGETATMDSGSQIDGEKKGGEGKDGRMRERDRTERESEWQ